MNRVVLPAVLIAGALAGCAYLPTAGPTTSDILKQEVRNNLTRFDLVDIDDNVVAALLASPNDSFRVRFKKYGKPPEPKIGVGDGLTVSIWEAAGGGLFGTSPTEHVSAGSRSVTLPQQIVTQDAAISVPFGGRIQVAGRRPLEVQHEIERRLTDKAIEPQVIVTITRTLTNTATETGEVIARARITLSLTGCRFLDLMPTAVGA